MSGYSTEPANAFNFCLWALSLTGPCLVVAAGHWRRLSGTPHTNTHASNAGLWLGLIALYLVASFIASVGVGYAYVSYAFDDTNWIAAIILSVVTWVPLQVWAMTARPDTDVGWMELVGLIVGFGTSVSALVFFFIAAGAGGSLANYLPAGLFFPLPVVLLVLIIVAILEKAHAIPAYYSKLSEEPAA